MGKTLHPYQAISKFSTDIYTVDGSFLKSPLGRRMTVVKTGPESLFIHSAIGMDDKDLRALDQLGRVTTIVVPNTFHNADAAFYKARYPSAKLLTPENLTANEQKSFTPDGVITQDQGPWNESIQALQLQGTRSKEVVFFHKLSQTLILTDLAFNFKKGDFQGLASILMGFNQADQGFAPTRLSKLVFFQDKKALGQSLREVLNWPIENIIVSHGRNVQGNGREVFEKAFDTLLNS